MAGFSGNRGVPQSYSPYNPGFTSFASAPRPTPTSTGFTPPPGATGQSLFAPPPGGMAARGNITNALMNQGGGFTPPPPQMVPGAPGGGFAPPAPPTGIGTGGLFAPPPTPGAPMSTGALPVLPPRPFQNVYSPGALANPGGMPTRGGGF